jgi:glucose/arabinose dehydrogenase
LAETGLERTEVIFRQVSKVSGGNHFGSRLAFSPDGHLFVTLGERFKFEPAQDLSNHLGTVVRIRPDGSVPDDNPFVGRENARPEIWSYGHRNIEAAAIHPGSGALWIGEMGPKGGDELNVPEAGKNYGWPVVSWGEHYDGEDIPDPPTQPRFADAIHQWTPVISPSGMIFYDGSGFPDWRGDLLIGSLTRKALMRVSVEGGAVTGEEQIDMGARIRDVEQGPDGAVYLLTDQDDGAILRLAPDTAEEGG